MRILKYYLDLIYLILAIPILILMLAICGNWKKKRQSFNDFLAFIETVRYSGGSGEMFVHDDTIKGWNRLEIKDREIIITRLRPPDSTNIELQTETLKEFRKRTMGLNSLNQFRDAHGRFTRRSE